MVLGDRRVVDDLDALGREALAQLQEDRRVLGDELEDALAGVRQLLAGRPPVGRPGDGSRLDLLAQAGDADLEELVEVAGEDRQELDPLEERIAGIARLVEDPRVELEPGQLAIEVREARAASRLGDAPWACREPWSEAGGPGSTAAISSGRLLCVRAGRRG